MADSEWDKLTTDFSSCAWIHTFLQLPFLEARMRRFVEERGGAPWKVLDVGCGMGKHTLMVLRAGASYVLAFDVSQNMVDGAKMATEMFLQSRALPGSPRADFVVASAANCSAIPGAQEGTFDLAICIYVMCNVQSQEEIKQALAEIYKMLKPGGKLVIYEAHILQYMQWNEKPEDPLLYKIGWGTPKEDGTKWGYFEDEGKPREITLGMNSERDIKFTNRVYTLSSWFSWILEAGFQIRVPGALCAPEGRFSRCTGASKVRCRKSIGNVLGVLKTIVTIDDAGWRMLVIRTSGRLVRSRMEAVC